MKEVLNTKGLHFWEDCVRAGCTIIAVPVYSQYTADGNIAQHYSIGIKYAALPFSNEAVGPDYYIQIEESQTGVDNLFDNPVEALAFFIRSKK